MSEAREGRGGTHHGDTENTEKKVVAIGLAYRPLALGLCKPVSHFLDDQGPPASRVLSGRKIDTPQPVGKRRGPGIVCGEGLLAVGPAVLCKARNELFN